MAQEEAREHEMLRRHPFCCRGNYAESEFGSYQSTDLIAHITRLHVTQAIGLVHRRRIHRHTSRVIFR